MKLISDKIPIFMKAMNVFKNYKTKFELQVK